VFRRSCRFGTTWGANTICGCNVNLQSTQTAGRGVKKLCGSLGKESGDFLSCARSKDHGLHLQPVGRASLAERQGEE